MEEDKGNKFQMLLERYRYSLFIIAIALLAGVIGFIFNVWETHEGFLYDLLTTIISTAIAFFVFTLTYESVTRKSSTQSMVDEMRGLFEEQRRLVRSEFRNEVDDSIVKSLGAELDIIQKYSSNEVFDVVNNCSARLLGHGLAENMQNVLASILNNPSYRASMRYNIDIYPNDTARFEACTDAEFYISQTLEYKKYLRRVDSDDNKLDENSLKLSCFFAFNKNPFLQKEQEEIFFLREELSSSSFIKLLNKENAIHLFDYWVQFFYEGDWVDLADIDSVEKQPSVEFVRQTCGGKYAGIKFVSNIPKQVLIEDDEYIYFKARIKCSYPTSRREFYFKVPELTLQADVSIELNSTNDSLHLVSFTDNYYIQLDKKSDSRESYNFCCNSKDSILLPNNGFTAVW